MSGGLILPLAIALAHSEPLSHPLARVNLQPAKVSADVPWHLMWNHPEGTGAACGAEGGYYTLSIAQVTCERCKQIDKENPQ